MQAIGRRRQRTRVPVVLSRDLDSLRCAEPASTYIH
jgi:hypothetical protein